MTAYNAFVQQWNKRLKIIGKNADWNKLMEQSLALQESILQIVSEKHTTIDIGAGAGLLGIVWLIHGMQDVRLIERSHNRYCFLKYCLEELNLPGKAYQGDVSEMNIADLQENLVITAQAFATIKNLLDCTKQWHAQKPVYVLLKQQDLQAEVEEASKAYNFQYQETKTKFGKIISLKL